RDGPRHPRWPTTTPTWPPNPQRLGGPGGAVTALVIPGGRRRPRLGPQTPALGPSRRRRDGPRHPRLAATPPTSPPNPQRPPPPGRPSSSPLGGDAPALAPNPPALAPSRRRRDGPRHPWSATTPTWPPNPQRSRRPGGAVTALVIPAGRRRRARP